MSHPVRHRLEFLAFRLAVCLIDCLSPRTAARWAGDRSGPLGASWMVWRSAATSGGNCRMGRTGNASRVSTCSAQPAARPAQAAAIGSMEADRIKEKIVAAVRAAQRRAIEMGDEFGK